MITYTATVQELGTGVQRRYEGNGTTDADAQAEIKKLLLLVCGTVLSVTKTENVADISGFVANAATQYSDVNLHFQKAGVSGTIITKTRHIENIATTYRLPGSKGLVFIAHPDMAAYATAYRDGQGVGGYTLVSGQYVR